MARPRLIRTEWGSNIWDRNTMIDSPGNNVIPVYLGPLSLLKWHVEVTKNIAFTKATSNVLVRGTKTSLGEFSGGTAL